MLVIHDSTGLVVGLQLFPTESDQTHIAVDDSLFDSLEPLITSGLRLTELDGVFALPENLQTNLDSLAIQNRFSEKKRELDLQQTNALTAGVPFSFRGIEDVVQTRGERDLININGVTTQAMLLKAAGVAEPVIQFRAQSNSSYMLTPDDAIELGVAVAAHSQAVYEKAWALKDALAAATTIEELEAVQW